MSVEMVPLDDDLVEGILMADIQPGEVADFFCHAGVPTTTMVDRTDRVVAIECDNPTNDPSVVTAIADLLRTRINRFYIPAWAAYGRQSA